MLQCCSKYWKFESNLKVPRKGNGWTNYGNSYYEIECSNLKEWQSIYMNWHKVKESYRITYAVTSHFCKRNNYAYSTIQHIFNEHLLCAKYYPKVWRHRNEQNKQDQRGVSPRGDGRGWFCPRSLCFGRGGHLCLIMASQCPWPLGPDITHSWSLSQ